MTVSNNAMKRSAFDFRSSSLLWSSAKSGTRAGYATGADDPGPGGPEGPPAGVAGYPGPVSDTSTPVIAPVVAPVETPTESTSPVDTDGGDHDRFAHYARKDDVARAYVTGEAITALCGKKWVPTRDPSRYPICPTCVERKAAGWSL